MNTPANQDELFELLDALVSGTIAPAEHQRLEAVLAANPSARRLYFDYLDVHVHLRQWQRAEGSEEGSGVRGQGSEVSGQWSGVRDQGSEIAVGAAVELPHQLDAASAEFIPPIIIDTSSPAPAPLLTTLFAPGGWAFSYAAATAITGVILLVLWGWRVSHEVELAEAPPPQVPPLQQNIQPQAELVGHITGTADCRWAGLPAGDGAAIRLGDKYVLSSGLAEISYQSGAKVILEGPCAYEVDSPVGGFLSLGKLTARVEQLSAISGQRSETPSPKTQDPRPESEISRSPNLQSSQFVVRTPTAVVTDLGTEFGVEVEKSGATRSHVFRGKVELKLRNPGAGQPKEIVLGRNEGVRVVDGGGSARAVLSGNTEQPQSPGFARQMPQRVRMQLFNTGVGLKEGDEDPHWQVVARTDDPHFKTRPAVVTRVLGPQWLANAPSQSQWLSLGADMPDLPDAVTYTFRTTFEAPGLFPGSAVLRGRFIVDNHVKAIRLNGEAISVDEHGYSDFLWYEGFSAKRGFVEGTNTLEVDVENHDPNTPPPGPNPMALRVEFEGDYLYVGDPSVGTPAVDQPPQPKRPRKEGSPMD